MTKGEGLLVDKLLPHHHPVPANYFPGVRPVTGWWPPAGQGPQKAWRCGLFPDARQPPGQAKGRQLPPLLGLVKDQNRPALGAGGQVAGSRALLCRLPHRREQSQGKG